MAATAGAVKDGPLLVVPACGAPSPAVVKEIARLRPRQVIALGPEKALCSKTLKAAARKAPTARVNAADAAAMSIHLAGRRWKARANTVYVAAAGDVHAAASASYLPGPVLAIPKTAPGQAHVAKTVAAYRPTRVVSLSSSRTLPPTLIKSVSGKVASVIGAGDAVSTSSRALAAGHPKKARVLYLVGDAAPVDAVLAGVATDGPFAVVPSRGGLPAPTKAQIGRLKPETIIAVGTTRSVPDATVRAAAGGAATTGRVAIPATTEVLTSEELSALRSFDSGTGRLTMHRAGRAGEGIAVGDVIAAAPSRQAPEGILRKVTRVDAYTDNLVYETQSATVAEAVGNTNGPVHVQGVPVAMTVNPSRGVSVHRMHLSEDHRATATRLPGGGLQVRAFERITNPVQYDMGKVTLKVKQEFKGSETDGLSGALSLEGEIESSAAADLALDVSPFGVKQVRLQVTPRVGAKLTGSMEGAIEIFKREAEIGSTDRLWYFQVGPVPIALTDRQTVKLGATAKISGKSTLETGLATSVGVGFQYVNGAFSSILDPKVEKTAPRVVTSGAGEIKLSAAVAETVKAYGLAGVELAGGPYAKGEYKLEGAKDRECSVALGVEATAGVLAGVKIWGIDLGERKLEATVEREAFSIKNLCPTAPKPDGGPVGPRPNGLITFDEFPLGTRITTQYARLGVVFRGAAYIMNDGATDTTPVLGTGRGFKGLLEMVFVEPGKPNRPSTAGAVRVDLGFLDDEGAVVTWYGAKGEVRGKYTATNYGREHLPMTGPISRITIDTSKDSAGVSVDNLRLG